MDIQNILLAFDFSKSSEYSLRVASALARENGATLHIMHVKEPFAVYKLGPEYGDVPPNPEIETLNSALHQVVPDDASIKHKHWLYTGENVGGDVLKLAGEIKADLIVMGTHGRKGLSRLILGSVAAAVIRRAECPVLTLKHPATVLEES